MSDPRTFVIVGAGQAGRWLVQTLRAEGFAGRIVWFGDEPHAAYDRPPLSKAVLQGEVEVGALALLGAEQFAQADVQWRPGEAVIAIDRARRIVRTERGDEVGYDTLFLATGGRARGLPGLAPHPRIATLRSFEDALAIKAALAAAQRVLVLGGGWIGLEVAASARLQGKDVTVLEAAPRLCVRTVPPCVSDELLRLHESHGVAVRLGDAVQGVVPSDDGVSVRMASGAEHRGDLLVVGIGMLAADTLAAEAGLAVDNGVLTDASGRTADPAVFAVGDVANAQRSDGRRLRIESWENAERQAIAAARAALGVAFDPDRAGPPWFWSDQFDANVQLLGLPDASQRVIERCVSGRREQRTFFFCEGSRVRAVAAVNAGRDVKLARKWIQQDRYPVLEALADPAQDLAKLPTSPPHPIG
jgi:3-phenylpropionate/trans-cinnamate dioxygenase ferredoxin reductase subunit